MIPAYSYVTRCEALYDTHYIYIYIYCIFTHTHICMTSLVVVSVT